jgi:hypothetical protein
MRALDCDHHEEQQECSVLRTPLRSPSGWVAPLAVALDSLTVTP